MVTYADTAAIAQAVGSLGTANLRQSFTPERQEKGTIRARDAKPAGIHRGDRSGS
jgi:hypothetical protein